MRVPERLKSTCAILVYPVLLVLLATASYVIDPGTAVDIGSQRYFVFPKYQIIEKRGVMGARRIYRAKDGSFQVDDLMVGVKRPPIILHFAASTTEVSEWKHFFGSAKRRI
jgi:hypothetical protein